MNHIKYLSILTVSLVAVGCGGGDAKDATNFSVQPSGFSHLTTCPGSVTDSVSVHTVNGGRAPFRLRSVTPGLEVGFASPTDNRFVEASASNRNADGDLILDGRDPKFAIRATLGCNSDVSVIVLDDTSAVVSVSIKVEAQQ